MEELSLVLRPETKRSVLGRALEVISNIIIVVEARVSLRQWASCFVTLKII